MDWDYWIDRGGITLIVAIESPFGFLLIIGGSLVSWLSSLAMYGFGQLIENSDKLVAQQIQYSLLYEKKFDEVIAALKPNINYKGDKDKISESNLQKFKGPNVGDYIKFGTYEQDNDTSNGKENIEWLVLDKKDKKILVISKYALDCLQYHTGNDDATWETCTLRKWLNGTFLNSAFTKAEKAKISMATVLVDKNPDYDTNPGQATHDKVFLLGIAEVNKYFGSDGARKCKSTAYADAHGTCVDENGNCFWWLLSPGSVLDSATFVCSDGYVVSDDNDVTNDYTAVRPAMWIDIS